MNLCGSSHMEPFRWEGACGGCWSNPLLPKQFGQADQGLLCHLCPSSQPRQSFGGAESWSLQVWVTPVLTPLWAEQGKGEVPLNAAQTEGAGRSSTRSQEPISWPTAMIPGRTLLTDACDSFGKPLLADPPPVPGVSQKLLSLPTFFTLG